MMIDEHLENICSRIGFSVDHFRKIATILEITNVSEYYTNSIKSTYQMEDFPVIRLPWAFVWAEYNITGDMGFDNNNRKVLKKVGIFAHDILDLQNPDRKQGIYLFFESIKGFSYSGRCNLRQTNNEWFIELYYKNIKDGIDLNEVSEFMIDFLGPFFLALSFCHCKNIIIDKSQINDKLNKKRIKKGKLPFLRFNTIQIDPLQKIIKREGFVEKSGLKKALHICRGHFATYNNDAPLFGKVTGTFWKPMHLKGNKKEGVVIKDYKIVAPE